MTVVVLITAILLACPVPSPAGGRVVKARKHGPARVLEVVTGIAGNLEESRYQHHTQVSKREGRYLWDCSGMAAWVLKRSAPAALKAVGRPNGRRPLAVHFYRRIARVPPGERRGPWYRVPTAFHAQPGDVLAWKRPKWFPSKSTGHVAFVVSTAQINHGPVQGALLRIADASKFRHEDDSRGPGETGFGIGTILVPTDSHGQPTGYGWVGSETKPDWVVPAEVAIGRPLR